MSKDKSYLFDMYTACELILEFTSGLTFEQFQQDVMRQDAVIRRFEILGEASSKLSDEFKEKHPDFQWALIRAMRNRLVHDYGEVDLELVWTTVGDNIPALLEQLKPQI